jgi:hypothetical protein
LAQADRVERPVATSVASGSEETIYRDRARRLGLSYSPFVRIEERRQVDTEVIHRGSAAISGGVHPRAYIAPDEASMMAARRLVRSFAGASFRLSVTTPTAIRAALRSCGAEWFVREATGRLLALDPSLSARRVATRPQTAILVLLVATAATAMVAAPMATILLSDVLLALLFFAVTVLRSLLRQACRCILP